VPGYAAILFRRTYADLIKPGAIMDRAGMWLRGTAATWTAATRTWRFPSGAVLTFGHLEHRDDKFEYSSTEFQYLGFDELSHFIEDSYTFMLSRLRRKMGFPVPLRARAGTNPGGPGMAWVKQRFLTNGPSEGRPFIPATLLDNPHIDAAEYRKALAQLDEVTRAQLEEGRWDVVERGPMFDKEWFVLIDEDRIPPGVQWVRYWDLAATKQPVGQDAKPWTAGVKLGFLDGIYYVGHVKRLQGTPKEVEDAIAECAAMDGAEVPIRMEQEPGSGGVNTIDHYAREVLKGFDFDGDKKSIDKVAAARPISSAAQKHLVRVVEAEWTAAYTQEFHVFPQRGFAKDQVDATSGAQRHLTGPVDPDAAYQDALLKAYGQRAA
jgi:predicted phage terminase large subunit-like protein